MCRYMLAGMTGLLAVASSPSQAQDLVGSANSVTRSYNYVELQYLPEMDNDLPILALAVVDLNDNWSLRGEYLRQEETDNSLGVAIDAEAIGYSIGLLYHQPLQAMENSDWVAGLMIGRIEIEVTSDLLVERLTEEIDFQEFYLGIRRTLSPELEGEIGLNAYRGEEPDGSNDTSISGDLKLVYRIRPSLDIALSLNEIGETDLLGIGLRYTWN